MTDIQTTIENLYSPEIHPVANNMRDVEKSLTNLTNSERIITITLLVSLLLYHYYNYYYHHRYHYPIIILSSPFDVMCHRSLHVL